MQHQLDSGQVDLPAGPYAASFHDLIAEHHTILSEALLAYDRMASLLAADHTGWVITHGEPKINNILITSNGPVMIDWDTVRLAPPTRDLWMTGGHQRYAELTGRQLPSEQLDFYRLRWDLADLCSYGSWFCRPHEATPDIQLGWQGAVAICARLSAGTPGPPWAQQTNRHTVPNFLAPGDDVGRGWSVETRQRLIKIKRGVDPLSTIRSNRSVVA